jgi:DNA-binding IclR family transcriptional regulator
MERPAYWRCPGPTPETLAKVLQAIGGETMGRRTICRKAGMGKRQVCAALNYLLAHGQVELTDEHQFRRVVRNLAVA